MFRSRVKFIIALVMLVMGFVWLSKGETVNGQVWLVGAILMAKGCQWG